MKEWFNAHDIFSELNKKYSYLVIRNHEEFYDSILMGNHADIDILCSRYDRKAIVHFLDAKPRLIRNDGIHYQIKICSELIPLDIRCVGDGYYDSNWENDMLNSRILDPRGFYCMDKDNYFWSLLYHAIYHKGKISDEYLLRLKVMKPDLFPSTSEQLCEKLHDYMLNHNYFYTIAHDRYLWYYFSEYCDGRIRAYPFYNTKQFIVKCYEYAKNKLKRYLT